MIGLKSRAGRGFMYIFFAFIIGTFWGELCTSIEFCKNASAEDKKPIEENVLEDTTSAGSGENVIDPQADSLLKEMSYFLGSKYNYTFKAEMMFDKILSSGRKLQFSAEENVFFQKPNKLQIDYISDDGGYKLWYDGQNLTFVDFTRNLYSKVVMTNTVYQILNELLKEYGYSPPFSEFLFVDPYKIMIGNVKAGYYEGASKVFGVKCQHLSFVEENIDWQICIEDGQRKIPRKLVITYKKIPGSPQFIAILGDWIFDQNFTEFTFKPNSPIYAKEADMSAVMNGLRNNVGSVRGSDRNIN